MSEWFSVEEKTPELQLSISNGFMWESERVLVYSPHRGRVIASYYADEGKKRFWWWDQRHGTEQNGVTHWMPLPEPPKDGE